MNAQCTMDRRFAAPANRTIHPLGASLKPVAVAAVKTPNEVSADLRVEPLMRDHCRIHWISGDFARVSRQGLEVILQWDGQVWIDV